MKHAHLKGPAISGIISVCLHLTCCSVGIEIKIKMQVKSAFNFFILLAIILSVCCEIGIRIVYPIVCPLFVDSFFQSFKINCALFFVGAEQETDKNDVRCIGSPRRLPGYCILQPAKYFYNSEKKACVSIARGHCNGDSVLFNTEDECKNTCLENEE